MQLTIVTPERVVVQEEVEAVYGKTIDGELGILPKHVPLVAPLDIGVLNYVQGGKKFPLAIMNGLLSTDGSNVQVLTDAAEPSGEINAMRAQQAKERAEARLREANDDVDIARAQQSLARATVRLVLAGRR